MLTVTPNEAMAQLFDSLEMVSSNRIIIKYQKYRIVIEGEELQIKGFSKDEVLMGGKLLKVTFNYE